MVTAIVLIGLAAMTLTEIGLAVAIDARRTRWAVEDAQLRQLVMAANEFAVRHPDAGRYRVGVPEGVPATVTIEVLGDHTVDVEARLPGRQMSENLSLHKTGDAWEISQATIN